MNADFPVKPVSVEKQELDGSGTLQVMVNSYQGKYFGNLEIKNRMCF